MRQSALATSASLLFACHLFSCVQSTPCEAEPSSDCSTSVGSRIDFTDDSDAGCVPDDETALCAAQAVSCGVIQAIDNCGTPRVALCGQCDALGEVPFLPEPSTGLRCTLGAYEPGNPASSFAFETQLNEQFAFAPGLSDAGRPLTTLTWRPQFVRPPSVNRLFTLYGSPGSSTFDAVGIAAAAVEPHWAAAMMSGNEIAMNVEGLASLPSVDGMPPMVWYSRCYGRETLTPQSDAEFCASYGFECDSLTGTDNTGTLRTAACGSCSEQKVCRSQTYTPPRTENISWPAKQCRTCVAESDAHLCQRLGKSCDEVTALDDCGLSRSVNCGTCTSPTTCGGGGVPNVCGGVEGITCTTAVVATPPVGNGSGQCWVDGDGGVTLLGTQTFSEVRFDWNPQRQRYQFATTVPSSVWSGGVLELYLYSASATIVDWSEGEGMTSSRIGNLITVESHFQRSYPLGCRNSHIYSECRGVAPFVFSP